MKNLLEIRAYTKIQKKCWNICFKTLTIYIFYLVIATFRDTVAESAAPRAPVVAVGSALPLHAPSSSRSCRGVSLSLSLSRQAFLRAPFSRDRLSFFSVGTLRRESPGMNARTALLPIEAYGNQSRSEVSSVAYLSRKVNEV